MKIKIDPKKLITPIELLKGILQEVCIDVEEDAFKIITMNPEQVVCVVFQIPKAMFEIYEPDPEPIGVKIDDFYKLIKKAKDSLTMETKEGKLEVSFGNKKYGFGIIEIDRKKKQKIPDLKTPSKIWLETKKFSEVIEDSFFKDDRSLLLLVNQERFQIKYEEDSSNFEEVLECKELKSDGDFKCRFSIAFLRKMTSTKIAEEIVLCFGDDYPLKLDYVADGYTLSLILAPRVENV